MITVRQASPISRLSTGSLSISCTLPAAPVAGNRLVWLIGVDKNAGTWTAPTDFSLLQSRSVSSVSMMIADKVSDGSESGAISASWTGSFRPKAILLELEASGGATIVRDGSNSQQTESTGTSYATGAVTSGVSNPFAVAMWCNDSAKADPADPDPTGSWTGGFNTYDEDWFATAGVGEPGFVIATASVAGETSINTTFSHDGASDQMAAGIVIYSETGGSGGGFNPSFAANSNGVIQC